jgi:hypothetical protein
MSFDAIATNAAGTLAGVFGRIFTFERPNEHLSQITAIIRRDVETVDESGQVLMLERTVRFAKKDLPFTPKRNDIIESGAERYVIGRRLSDDGFSIEYEIST